MNSQIEPIKLHGVTLYNADCLLLRDLPADALISDPQYQLANGKKAKTMNSNRGEKILGGTKIHGRDWGGMSGDDEPYDPSPWLNYPVVILWGAIHYANRLPNSTSWLVWDKRENVASDDNADCEMAWSNIGGPARIHRQLWKGICRRGEENIATAGDKLHPFQKPVALMSWCLKIANLAPGATVVDPYMGSGTTGIACIRAGINFIGIERDSDYFKTATSRIKQELQQLVML